MNTVVTEGNKILNALTNILASIPESVIALLGRFSVAAVFWQSGQTKVDNFTINILTGEFDVGIPALNDSVVYLFEYEYALPLIPAEPAAILTAVAEHVLPLLLLLGLATRFAAFGLFLMTLVIQIFVYPDAYALHGTWAAILMWLMSRGAGALSFDAVLSRR
ncbi:DoxX [Luminiphilus syltensis NOR5-1B]|uniref:DoxX n=1 Tax=Luminiphilus syltensis NOR5-1B TaxID=565045 RepID=B8KWN3_9GAMM|nr:DoxX family protein [Luminiphilus syltensis]EED35392.1 DoxX [Luminiphilus syltensis NOR5-1B]